MNKKKQRQFHDDSANGCHANDVIDGIERWKDNTAMCVIFFPFSSSLLHACARRPMRHLNNFVDFALFGAVRVRFTRSNTALNFMSMCSF